MLVGEVRLPQGLWTRLSEALLADRSVETKAFLLCRTLESETRVVFLPRELVAVPAEAYAQRTENRVEIRPEFVHQVLVRCARAGYALLEAHSHPWMPNPHFSKIDNYSDLQKFQTTQSMSPPFRHGSLVFGSDMSFEGRFWDYQRQQMAPIVRLRVLRAPLETRYGTGLHPPHLREAERAVYDRQVRLRG